MYININTDDNVLRVGHLIRVIYKLCIGFS